MNKVPINSGRVLYPFTTIASNANIGKLFQAKLHSYLGYDFVIGDYVNFLGVKFN